MLRIITIPSLLWLCIGCSVGAGYYDPFPSSATARRIETATGSNLSGSDGHELGLFMVWPIYGRDSEGFFGVVELKNRYILRPDRDTAEVGVRLDGVTAGLTYRLRVWKGKVSLFTERVLLTGGLGVGRHHLDIEGLPGDTAWGVHASIGLELNWEVPFVGPFVEARYQMLNFDTAFGELDASGFQVVVGFRIDWSALRRTDT